VNQESSGPRPAQAGRGPRRGGAFREQPASNEAIAVGATQTRPRARRRLKGVRKRTIKEFKQDNLTIGEAALTSLPAGARSRCCAPARRTGRLPPATTRRPRPPHDTRRSPPGPNHMRSIKQALHALREQRRRRRATLPWTELEAEAARQSCSPADIFFDRAGRPPPDLPIDHTPAAPDPHLPRGKRQVRAPAPAQPTFDTRSKRT
jgi:hypothetical protein